MYAIYVNDAHFFSTIFFPDIVKIYIRRIAVSSSKRHIVSLAAATDFLHKKNDDYDDNRNNATIMRIEFTLFGLYSQNV